MKPISGAWFEFSHHSKAEGLLYNDALKSFTAAQWAAMIKDMRAMGMDTLVLTFSSIVYRDESASYAPVDVFPPADLACENPMDVMMDAAEAEGMGVFLSAGFYGFWEDAVGNMQSREVEKRAFRACEEMYGRYQGRAGFRGWYLPDETEAGPYFSPVFLDYVSRYAAFFRGLDAKKPILIAPYGTNKITPDDAFTRQLESMDVDYIAYQDEVGVQKSTPEQTAGYYAGLRKAHDRAGRGALWADIEMFDFTGAVYRSALVPAPMARLEKQIASVSPYVDKILCYAFPGLLARPGSPARYPGCAQEKLYADYMAYRKRLTAER
jgi:hypothetical protein